MLPSRDGTGRDGAEPGRESRGPCMDIDLYQYMHDTFFRVLFLAWRTCNSITSSIYDDDVFVLPPAGWVYFSSLSFFLPFLLVVLEFVEMPGGHWAGIRAASRGCACAAGRVMHDRESGVCAEGARG
ncbi:unnamed protein product [Ectocarpus fasciculatus]